MPDIARVLALFGTRPELIKLAPVFRALEADARVSLLRVSTGQQADLLPAFVDAFGVCVDHDLALMLAGQPLNRLLGGIVAGLDPLLERHAPHAVIVQGDTLSALGGALAARMRRIPVVHVEAGLRTGDPDSPFPEETSRRLISHIAALHCAATAHNRRALEREAIAPASILVTGNPVVDAVLTLAAECELSGELRRVLAPLEGRRLVVLTTHRRENFGARMRGYLDAVRAFAAAHDDVGVVFPVHPNPEVRAAAKEILGGVPGVSLTGPFAYADFVHLLSRAWLVLSDSGGVQEEVASLGKPMLILREVTERPEIIDAGMARLAESPERLADELRTALDPGAWCARVTSRQNPFGDGHSGPRIAHAIVEFIRHARSEPE